LSILWRSAGQGRDAASWYLMDRVYSEQHRLAVLFRLLDNSYASGESVAEGHHWACRHMYPTNREDVRAFSGAIRPAGGRPGVYTERIYLENALIWEDCQGIGEACTTHSTTIAGKGAISMAGISTMLDQGLPLPRHRQVEADHLSAYPTVKNLVFYGSTGRADIFSDDLQAGPQAGGEGLPDLMVLSLLSTTGRNFGLSMPASYVGGQILAVGGSSCSYAQPFLDSTVVYYRDDSQSAGTIIFALYRTTCSYHPYS